MWLLDFYRLYICLISALLSFFFLVHSIFLSLGIFIVLRALWWFIEWALERYQIQMNFNKFQGEFKNIYGPYGIRIINKAQNNFVTKKSLCEVFCTSPIKLKKAVEQLEVMDTLFKAGMQPQGDDYLLHDLKLKFGALRLKKLSNKSS
jgi:hypothetical protein